MSKKGFTLVEVLISIALVSLVLTGMLSTLVKLKEAYKVIHDDTDALIYGASAIRVINNDLNDNKGIRKIVEIESGKCGSIDTGHDKGICIYLSQDTDDSKPSRILVIDTILPGIAGTASDTTTTTLKYYNFNASDHSQNKLIYAKSLFLKEKDGTTEGYKFSEIKSKVYDFGCSETDCDKISVITLKILDGIDPNNHKYDVRISTALR